MSHDAFLRAILAEPDDDLPRLVYADYLDDVGDHPRAEFIRVQCDLARLPDDDPRRPALEDREHELLGEHEPTWLAPMYVADPRMASAEWVFSRGFLDQLRVTIWRLYDDLFDRHPIRTVEVLGDGGTDVDEPEMLTGEWSRRIARLDLSAWKWRIPDYIPVLGADAWAGLRELDLSGVQGIGEIHRLVAGAAFRTGLRSLAFGGRSGVTFRWGDAGNETLDVAGLNQALAGSRLERLAAFDCGLTTDGLRWLLAAPWAAHLTDLDVSENPIAPDAWRAFRQTPARLTRLDVSGTPLAGISLEPVLDSPAAEPLTRLAMNRCGSARRNMEVLAASRFWTRATELRAYGGTIPAMTLEPLCQSAGPPGLRVLELGDNYLRAEGVRMVCKAPWSRSLTWLGLNQNYLDDEAVEVLAAADLPHLRTLHLARNFVTEPEVTAVTDRGVVALAANPALARLRVLNLSWTGVGDRGAEAVLNGAHWRLSGLGLSALDLSPRFVEALARSPRLARLDWLDLSSNPRLSGSALLPLAESPYLSRLCELNIDGLYPDAHVLAAFRDRLGPRLTA